MTTTTIKDFIKNYDESEVYYDEAFQRRVVWRDPALGKFIMSVTKGWGALGTIVVADVKICHKHSLELRDYNSVKYFEDVLAKGFRYISLDGQNRSKKLIEFLENEISISGEFPDADGLEHKIVNKFFKDLPQRLQDRIGDASLNVQIAPPCLRSELPHLFEALNSGEPLNSHEKRNSKASPIAAWVRRTSKELSVGLARVVSEQDTKRMLDDELVAKMAMVLMQNDRANKNGSWNLGSDDIDRFYDRGITYENIDDPACPYSVDKTEKVLKMWEACMVAQKYYNCSGSRTIASKQAWAILYVCEWIYDNHYYIEPSSYASFFRKIKELDDKLATDSQSEYAAKCTAASEEGSDPDKISKGTYYFAWLSLPHQSKYRDKRAGKLVEKVNKDPAEYSLRMSASSAAK